MTTSTQKSVKGLPETYVAGIFKKFSAIYGHLWDSQVGTQRQMDSKLEAWRKELYMVEPIELRRGLDNLPEKPPSAIAFRNLCLQTGNGKRYQSAAHKPFPKALPKPKAKPEVVAREIAKMREALK